MPCGGSVTGAPILLGRADHVTRLLDRMLARTDSGYNEYMYSGAYAVTTSDPSGRNREGVPAGIVRTAREAYTRNGIVYACVAARMALFSECRFQLQSTVDRHLFGQSSLSLLEYPWPNATAGELLARMENDVSTAGNSYIRKVRPGGRVGPAAGPDAPRLRDDRVGGARRRRGPDVPAACRVLRGPDTAGDHGPGPAVLQPDEVCHYSPVPDPLAQWRGMSWLTPVLREIGADQALTDYKTVHLGRGAMPGLVLKYSQKLSQPSVDRLKKRFEAMYSGPENSGRTLVLDEGADVTVAGSTLEQLQYVAVQAAGETRICAASMVPSEVIGIDGPRSASGNYELAIRRFADLWARPHWRMACASLQHLLPGVTAADAVVVRRVGYRGAAGG